MENLLLIDAVSSTISVCVMQNSKITSNFSIQNSKSHSEELMPLIDAALKFSDIDIKDIDTIICANGPGSFTGLRIALSSIKAIANVIKCKIYTVSTLRALSYYGKYSDYIVCPIMDARRKQVYACAYKNGKQIIEEKTWAISELVTTLNGQKTLFVGDGIAPYYDIIKMHSDQYIIADELCEINIAFGLYDAFVKGNAQEFQYNNLEVNYLRLAQAERERLQL